MKKLLECLNKIAIEEAFKLEEEKKSDELILSIPTKAKIIDNKIIIETPDVSVYNEIVIEDYKKICPVCKEKVRLGTIFITDENGQRIHYTCMEKQKGSDNNA